MRLTSLVTSLLAGVATAMPRGDNHRRTSLTGLNDIAQSIGKLWFGTATGYPTASETGNAAYMAVLENHSNWGQLTSGNYMKFQFLEPKQGVFNYTIADEFVGLAEKYNMYVRCHNLIWHTSLPAWLSGGTWTNATLQAVMKNHIYNVVQHYGDRCYSWDVVNEALNADGTWSSGLWYDIIGPEYFFLAFEYAQEAAAAVNSSVKLYYNDWGVETVNAKTNATIALVKEARARGIRIDGIGQESHFATNTYPSYAALLQAKQAYINEGLEVAVTELDVRIPTAPFYTASIEGVQAQSYYDTVASCVKAGAGCVGITVWDFDDQYSWIPAAYPGAGGADMYNATLDKKPAWYASQQALLGQTCTVC